MVHQWYREYLELVARVRDAGGVLLTEEEGKKVISFLGLGGRTGDEDEIISIETRIRSLDELKDVVGDIHFTPLFRKIMTHLLSAWRMSRGRELPKVLIQGMAKTGKTFAYLKFKDLVMGPSSEYIHLECKPDTSPQEIVQALQKASTGNNGQGALLLVHHVDNLPPRTQVVFHAIGYRGGPEGVLRRQPPGPMTVMAFEARLPETHPIETGLRARIGNWLTIGEERRKRN